MGFSLFNLQLTASLFIGAVFAGDEDSSTRMQKERKTGKPPESAILICVGKTDGDECTFSGHRGKEAGTCMSTPDKKYFFCNLQH